MGGLPHFKVQQAAIQADSSASAIHVGQSLPTARDSSAVLRHSKPSTSAHRPKNPRSSATSAIRMLLDRSPLLSTARPAGRERPLLSEFLVPVPFGQWTLRGRQLAKGRSFVGCMFWRHLLQPAWSSDWQPSTGVKFMVIVFLRMLLLVKVDVPTFKTGGQRCGMCGSPVTDALLWRSNEAMRVTA